MNTISVHTLSKYYQVPEREAGLKAALGSLFHRRYKQIKAVDGVSFEIEPGEMVGFLGPNGAGKTTTLKMLSGLLHPTAGQASVLGFDPYRRQREFLRQITLVMGQRNQLVWDIPAADSYDLNRAVYRIPRADFERTLKDFVDLLELGDLIKKPVRNLSLGERMKVEIAAALLHRPQVLFLDEPTLGLDVTMQRRIRTFIAEYNRRYNATILLTSHYMADITALCKRVIVIHHGHILFDGDLAALGRKFASYKKIVVRFETGAALSAEDMRAYGEVVQSDVGTVALRVPVEQSSAVTARLLADLPLADLTVEEPPIEDAIERVFASSAEVA